MLSYVSAMRLREDELFLRRATQDLPKGSKSNLRMVDLNLKDAPIRLRRAAEEVCSTPVDPADPAIDKIRKALARAVDSGAVDTLILPAALGNHVDHLTVREASSPFLSSRPGAFYEDLPYAATHPAVPADLDTLRRTATTDQPLTPVLCQSESAIDRKRALILGYASQIDAEAAGIICSFATRYSNGERLWANPAWCAIAAENRLSTPEPPQPV